MASFNICAHWDVDAQVWWAESDDVPGLVAEAATHDDLIADLRQVVPELLSLNMPNYTGAITLSITSDQVEQVSYA
jgi:hypothetical protein